MRSAVPTNDAKAELVAVLARSRGAMVSIFLMSAVLNVLLLGGSIYMMLVYDMVLPSRSVPTLIGLLAMVTVAYIFQGLIDVVRGRLLLHMSATVDMALGARIHSLVGFLSRTRPGRDPLLPIRDLDQVRAFLSGAGPMSIVDLPWMFFFIIILFLLHPLLGLTVLIGAVILLILTFMTDRMSGALSQRVTRFGSTRGQVAEVSRRHADVLFVMGMEKRMQTAWTTVSSHYLAAQEKLSGISSTMGGISKMFRLLLQSVVLTVGALLVMSGKASGGVIFASSILSARALAPVETVIANWRNFIAARQSWARLKELLNGLPDTAPHQTLPAPRRALSVEDLTLRPVGSTDATVHNVSFLAQAGEAIAVLGPSGCGKSTLVRGIVGILEPATGSVRLDGASIQHWSPENLGPHIGYLPQNVELLGGTIAENIARFEPDAPSDLVIAAARLAGVHDLILHLPEGYNTQVGNDGARLSAGQRQRIALARALYRDPFLLVLDEPNSNLDAPGEEALADAVRHACGRGAVVVLVAHRPSILSAVDLVLLMKDGHAHAFGRKERLVPHLLTDQRTEQRASA